MKKRLFIKLPLVVLSVLSILTFVIPLVYWIITGREYIIDVFDKIEDL